ncbi:ribonuclease Z [Simkania negevensis]|uniref:Ribonuclease Z n=1 Tax=Simkania negevensis TaxID=83561 RepID=A0ABS3AQI6_9BACT|nr:ribonuclease Z [Simkania negevensis]
MSVRDLTILGCSGQQPTRYRNHGAYLLRWNNEGLLFDPGEGTQRQFIHANIAPTCITRIFVSHFHGDHCLGLGSILMRLNLDKVRHTIHCYYPKSGKKYFDHLRYGTIYHDTISVQEHPVDKDGIVHDDGRFVVEAAFLEHGIDNVAWRITEPDSRKFDKEKLLQCGVSGPKVRELEEKGMLVVNGKTVSIDDVSRIRKGDAFAMIMDTRKCPQTIEIAQGAKMLLCESTYLDRHRELAYQHYHLTAKQAAEIAKEAQVQQLILSHFSARYLDLNEFVEESRSIFPNSDVGCDFKQFPFPKGVVA